MRKILTLVMAFFAFPALAQYQNEQEVFSYYETGIIQGAVPIMESQLRNCDIQQGISWLPTGWDPAFTLKQTVCVREGTVVAYFMKEAEADTTGQWFGWPELMGISFRKPENNDEQPSVLAENSTSAGGCTDAAQGTECIGCRPRDAVGGIEYIDAGPPYCPEREVLLNSIEDRSAQIYFGLGSGEPRTFLVRWKQNLFEVPVQPGQRTVEFVCEPDAAKSAICSFQPPEDASSVEVVLVSGNG